MVTQCGGIPASATAACLFTLGEPKKFQIAVNVAASGDCAAQKTANENAVKKYIDLGGTVVNTHVISIVTSTKTGTQNANCLVDLIRPDF